MWTTIMRTQRWQRTPHKYLSLTGSLVTSSLRSPVLPSFRSPGRTLAHSCPQVWAMRMTSTLSTCNSNISSSNTCSNKRRDSFSQAHSSRTAMTWWAMLTFRLPLATSGVLVLSDHYIMSLVIKLLHFLRMLQIDGRYMVRFQQNERSKEAIKFMCLSFKMLINLIFIVVIFLKFKLMTLLS